MKLTVDINRTAVFLQTFLTLILIQLKLLLQELQFLKKKNQAAQFSVITSMHIITTNQFLTDIH